MPDFTLRDQLRVFTGTCANCERRRALDDAGLVVEHWEGRWRCLGSQQYPEPDGEGVTEADAPVGSPWPAAS